MAHRILLLHARSAPVRPAYGSRRILVVGSRRRAARTLALALAAAAASAPQYGRWTGVYGR